MAYAVPTINDLKTRFPVFETIDDCAVGMALAEAALVVDETWIEGDFAPARLLLAAHVLTLDGFGPSAQAAGFQASGIRSFQSGQLSVTFADSAKAASFLGTTSYGQRFLAISRRNNPAVLAVNGVV